MLDPLQGSSDRQGLRFGVGVHESARPDHVFDTQRCKCFTWCMRLLTTPLCACEGAAVLGLFEYSKHPGCPGDGSRPPRRAVMSASWNANARADTRLCVLPRCRWLTCQRMWRTNSTVVRAMQMCVAIAFSTDVQKSILVDRSDFQAASWAATTRGHTIGVGCL